MAKEFGLPSAAGVAGPPASALETVRAVAEMIGPHKMELIAEMERTLEPRAAAHA